MLTAALMAAALAAAPAGAEVDVAELARLHQERQGGDASGLRVLVSFSMPAESLARLARDAGLVGAPLVLRGLHEGSVMMTARMLERIDPQGLGDWQVDPRAFRMHSSASVPVFALKTATGWETVRGDVSLAYALRELMARGGGTRIAAARLAALLEREGGGR